MADFAAGPAPVTPGRRGRLRGSFLCCAARFRIAPDELGIGPAGEPIASATGPDARDGD